MLLDAESCYRALLSRDARFDGRFFTAVKTTGVYCRPVCPAHPPRRENVRFFACAAAAEAAGFRPCRRCRPETSPGTPAWLGTSCTVTRALRLIADGALDHHPVVQLAERLGIGERQLRRLFARLLGASPVAVAHTRRVHFARQLLDAGSLPISQVAFCSGFSSIRQFNAALKATFGRTPSELRAHRRGRGTAIRDDRARTTTGGDLWLRLPYRAPFDWDEIVAFLRPRATPGVEGIDSQGYRRSITLDGTSARIEVRPGDEGTHLLLRLQLPALCELGLLVERVKRLFDLGADPLQINSHLARDPLLAALVRRRPGLRVPGTWDGFELAVRAVLGQQVTVRAATTFAGRLVRAFGTPLEHPADGITHLFPRPEQLADAPLVRVGLIASRAAAIRALARAVCRGAIALDGSIPDDEARAQLRAIPGIGAWTTEYIAMRALREPDAFPAEDLALRHALGHSGSPATARQTLARAQAWSPWRAYAVMHLWSADTHQTRRK